MKKKVRLIGLTGTNSAGKGEAAAYFQKRGYAYVSLSDVIRDELEKDGIPITRDNLIRKGNEMRETQGADVLARLVTRKIKGKTVVDSIRNPQEVEFLRGYGDLILLAIDAPVELRFVRAKKRGREESASTLQEFIAKEAEEITDLLTGQQLSHCIQLADFKIYNDSTLENLSKKLEEFV
ncbi:MAG: hypothetical protein AMJ73_00155 [candidate division Zixibacteria bacterium SM1_73]|nr:MAG: hypothetical protein AMJ73_00155 [candidate division Zixibacteria bacterium SM1_73]